MSYIECFYLKNTPFCFLPYILRKWSNLHKNIRDCSWANSNFCCVKIIKLVNIYSLLSVTQFWYHVDLWDLLLKTEIFSADIYDVKGLALCQEGKPQTHSAKVRDLLHISVQCACWSVAGAHYPVVVWQCQCNQLFSIRGFYNN